nr:unnamed protein product [Callosobruchus chinensis]
MREATTCRSTCYARCSRYPRHHSRHRHLAAVGVVAARVAPPWKLTAVLPPTSNSSSSTNDSCRSAGQGHKATRL